MKIGNYEISPSAIFYVTAEDGLPVSVNAGKDIPMSAIWINGEPKEYNLSAYHLPITKEKFYELAILDHSAS